MNEFLKIYLNTFYIRVTTEIKLLRSSNTLNHVQVVNVSRYYYIFISQFDYTKYCNNNKHLITSNGRINIKIKNSTINKLCHKNECVLFSRDHYTASAPVLSDIDGSGPREKAYIL